MRIQKQDLKDQYLDAFLTNLDPWESQARSAAESLNLAGISLSKAEAQLLRWLAQRSQGQKAVEIGTLTGLSGLYILDGLKSGGHLWTLEKDSKHASLARPLLQDFAKKQKKHVTLLEGDARETLTQISTESPFDFIFIDGNKAAYVDYLDWAEKHTKSGAILVADNVFLSGTVLNDEVNAESANFSKKQRQVMREFNERVMRPGLWRACFVPTLEGMLIAERS